ncbi:DNA internalization-related competence protein ComEC/Rec2 [Balneolaceae bacterium ANBcel3]|nr:DNA internalization-related competence protein ComEC/Rec2 [Balneolaceae bacterium ANBcel3]
MAIKEIPVGAYPLLRLALLLIAGIVLSNLTTTYISTAALLWVCFAWLILTIVLNTLRAASYYRQQASLLCYLILVVLFGFSHHRLSTQPEHADERLLKHFPADQLVFYGVVHSQRNTRSDNRLLTIQVDSVEIHALPMWLRPFTTEAFLQKPDSTLHIQTGTKIVFHGDLSLPDSPTNPNQFDYASFLASRNIYSRIFISEIIQVKQKKKDGFWTNQQLRLHNALGVIFNESNTGLARAILLGDRSGLSPDIRVQFSRAGLAHMMAVSGMHVGFILLPVWLVMPWFRRNLILRCIGLTIGAGVLFYYAGITGFSVSVSRASLMAFFMMVARLFHRPGTSINILGAAAFILLLHQPALLYDIGFQLSFSAVAVILTTLGPTRRLLPVKYRYGKMGALFQFLSVSILVQSGLFPILVYYFNEFSIAGPLSNSLAVPFIQCMFLWAFFCFFLYLFVPQAAAVLNVPGDYILTALSRYVNIAGNSPYSWLEVQLPGPLYFLIWFFLIALFASYSYPFLRWKMLCGLLLSIAVHSALITWESYSARPLRITFFDVGQADAVLIETPSGYNYLYDTGLWTPTFDSGERVLLPELKARGIHRLDGVILSHPHADHIGGILSLIHNIPIDTIYQSPATYDSRLYHNYMLKARQKNIPVRLLSSGEIIHTDPAVPMLVLSPDEHIRSSLLNDHSVVLMVLYGNTRILLTGDAEKEAERFLADRYRTFLRSDLLKVGHHGSKTSSTFPFMTYVSAEKAIVSLGFVNRHHHPDTEAIVRLNSVGVNPRYTSLEGAIIYHSYGKKIKYYPW